MISGRKVRLRHVLEQSDHERIVAWRNGPEAQRWFLSDGAITLASHLAWYEHVQADSTQVYFFIDAVADENGVALGSPAPIGVVGLAGIDMHDRCAEFGRFMIGHPDFRGHGYGREAAYLVCEYAFGTLGLNRLWAEVISGNERALRVYRNIGFCEEGVLQEHVLKGGRFVDVVRIGVLARDFLGRCNDMRCDLGLDDQPAFSLLRSRSQTSP